MASTTPNRIRLVGRDDFRREGIAAGTVTPGDAVEVSGESSGVDPDPQIQRQSTAAAAEDQLLFAVEYAKTGRNIDQDYSSGDDLEYFPALNGEYYYAFHNTAEDIAYGDSLVLSGDGTLRALDTAGGDSAAATVAEAREAVTNSGGPTKTRMKIEVIK